MPALPAAAAPRPAEPCPAPAAPAPAPAPRAPQCTAPALPPLQPGLSDLWPGMSSGSTAGASPALPLRGWRSRSAPPELSPRVAVMLGRDPALLSHAARAVSLSICDYCVHNCVLFSPPPLPRGVLQPVCSPSFPLPPFHPASDLLAIWFLSLSQCVFLMWSCRKSSFTLVGSPVV